jgi:DNA-directed RNA polymerase specialized sigma subunit
MQDMKQEFRLVCWEAWSGQGGFDSAKGTLQGYFIGKVKTLLYKRDGYSHFDHLEDEEIQTSDHEEFCASAKSPLDLLIEQEEQNALDRNNRARTALDAFLGQPNRGSWIRRLRQEGLSQSQIAALGGISQAHVSRVLKKEPAASRL